MALMDRFDSSVDRLAGRFASLIEDGDQQGGMWGGMVQQPGTGSQFGAMVNGGGGGSSWGGMVGNAAPMSWLSTINQGQSSPIDLSWLTRLENVRAAQDAAKPKPSSTGGWTNSGGGTGGGSDFGQGGTPSTGMEPDVARWASQTQQTFGDIIDPDVLLAIMTNESHGNPDIQNTEGFPAYGLFQLWDQPGLSADQQFAAARTLAQQKIANLNASYAAHGMNPDQRTRARDFALAWGGQFDFNTGLPSTTSQDAGSGKQNAAQLAAVFLGNYDKIKAGRQQASAPKGGGGGLASLTGGQGSISQEFGVVSPDVDQSIYDYGKGSGVSGHTGIDWAVPAGTQVSMPAGLTGTVETAGGTAFFRDEDENSSSVSPPGQGELKIRLSNGMELILGHMRSINVPVGTQLTPGQLVGISGSAAGGHVHVELRVADPSMPNGYRILDPRTLLGN